MIFNIKKNEGFTLLEVIFAITIIVIAVLAIFGLVNLGVKNIGVAKNKLIASELAQEGIELVRWWREDGHVDNWTDWYDPICINGNYTPAQVCGNFRFGVNQPTNPVDIDITTNATWGGVGAAMPRIGTEINSISDIPSFFQLRYNAVSKLYNYDNGTFTNFFRIINISSPSVVPADLGYKLVTVQVIWQDRAGLKSVQVYDKLYNWMAP